MTPPPDPNLVLEAVRYYERADGTFHREDVLLHAEAIAEMWPALTVRPLALRELAILQGREPAVQELIAAAAAVADELYGAELRILEDWDVAEFPKPSDVLARLLAALTAVKSVRAGVSS